MLLTANDGGWVVLDDGRRVLLRALRIDDEDALRRAFEEADSEVLRARFGGGIPPFSAISERLHRMDGVHRYAVAAFDDAGEIIGVAEYVQAEPEPTAEVAVVVDRDWQRHGIGTTLLARLADHAASVGITTVTALVSGSNGQVLELVDELPVPHQISYDHGEGVLKAELPSQS